MKNNSTIQYTPLSISSYTTYNKYINPWIRLLVLLIIVQYWIMVSYTIVTYRNIAYIHDLLNEERSQGFNVSTSSYSDYNRDDFVLKDLGFNMMPVVTTTSTYNSIEMFVDFTAYFWCAFAFCLNAFLYRDMIRIMEYGGYYLVLMLMNSIVHLLTTYPDSSGMGACTSSAYTSEGSYFANNFTTQFCGNMMWSDHTANTLLALIIIKRSITKTNHVENRSFVEKKNEVAKINHDYFFQHRTKDNQWKLSTIYVYAIVLFLFAWFVAFLLLMLVIRFHYSTDIVIAIIIVLFLTTNNQLIQWVVRWIYRPCYTNYKFTQWWKAVYLTTPLNTEQMEYEYRIKCLGYY